MSSDCTSNPTNANSTISTIRIEELGASLRKTSLHNTHYLHNRAYQSSPSPSPLRTAHFHRPITLSPNAENLHIEAYLSKRSRQGPIRESLPSSRLNSKKEREAGPILPVQFRWKSGKRVGFPPLTVAISLSSEVRGTDTSTEIITRNVPGFRELYHLWRRTLLLDAVPFPLFPGTEEKRSVAEERKGVGGTGENTIGNCTCCTWVIHR